MRAALGHPFSPPVPPLSDERAAIVLRPWRHGDAPALAAAWADPSIAVSCGVPSDPTLDHAATWISSWAERTERGVALDLVVADAATDAVVGEVGLWPFVAPPNDAAVPGVLELGWWTSASHRGAGRTSAAVRLVADWALVALAPQKLVARIDRGHLASEAVARRACLVDQGQLDAEHDLWVRSAANISP